MNEQQKKFLIELLQDNKEIPLDFKYLLFPTTHKEYELAYAGKMRKEDVLANEDGVDAIPLQIEKKFGNDDSEWKNMLIFGDNLQFLKTIYENKDPIIKNKIKNKIKLIYIDPPFATADEFSNKEGAKAYNDKKKGAEFIEFLRRRLIVAHEILSDDGYIAVHLDQKMNSYIRIILDEIFGKNNFINEIIWRYFMGGKSNNFFSKKHDTIYIYKKQGVPNLSIPTRERILVSKPSLIDEKSSISIYEAVKKGTKEEKNFYTSIVKQDDVFEISGVFNMGNEYCSYPTQKPEELLKNIILATTNEGDIVMDFFCGSGTTAVVSEKLNRKWVTCDLGKLSYFTIQKRLLQISNSNDLVNERSKYGNQAKPFIACRIGNYDLKDVIDLKWEKYCEFVANLFDIKLVDKKIAGYNFEGTKDGFVVKIWNYNKTQNSNVDSLYLDTISKIVGAKVGNRIYIVAPANSIDYIQDYEEINGNRFYFLKIPYQIIRELHKAKFQKIRQPQSKNKINDIDDVIGFHFIKKPTVKSEIIKDKTKVKIKITEFKSQYRDEEDKVTDNFETLSAIFIDDNYDGDNFVMTDVKFADELLNNKSKLINSDFELRKELKNNDSIIINLNIKNKSGKIMLVYTDIYGNDFVEIFEVLND